MENFDKWLSGLTEEVVKHRKEEKEDVKDDASTPTPSPFIDLDDLDLDPIFEEFDDSDEPGQFSLKDEGDGQFADHVMIDSLSSLHAQLGHTISMSGNFQVQYFVLPGEHGTRRLTVDNADIATTVPQYPITRASKDITSNSKAGSALWKWFTGLPGGAGANVHKMLVGITNQRGYWLTVPQDVYPVRGDCILDVFLEGGGFYLTVIDRDTAETRHRIPLIEKGCRVPHLFPRDQVYINLIRETVKFQHFERDDNESDTRD